jgi:hypothetical protein
MGNPTPITITIEALTERANSKISEFFNWLNAKLNASNAATTAPIDKAAEQTGEALKKLSGHSNNSRMAMMELGHVARATAEGLAMGMNPLRILAMEFPRVAQAATMSGISLASMIPYVGVLTAAVGAGYLVWNEWTSATRAAEKSAKDLHIQMEGLAKVYTQIRDLQKAGLLSPQAADRNLALMTGKIPLYKTRQGEFTTEATQQVADFTAGGISGSPVAPTFTDTGKSKTIANIKATGDEVLKYITDQITVQGKLDQLQVAAQAKNKEIRQAIHAESLLEAEQEKEAIHLKYEAEREELRQTAVAMAGQLTIEQERENAAAKALSFKNEAVEKEAVDFKVREKNRLAAEEAFAKGQQLFAEIIRKENADLERDLTLSAAQQGKTRQEIYQQEYDAKIKLLQSQLFSGEIKSIEDYNDAVAEAEIKRLEGLKHEQDELRRLAAIKEQMAQKDYDAQRRAIQGNPFLNNAQKNQQLQSNYAANVSDVGGQLAKNLATPMPASDQQQIQLLEQRKQLQSELNTLLAEQNKLQNEVGFINNLKADWTDFYNTVADTSRDLARLALSPFAGLRDGLAQSLETILEKGGSLKSFFLGVGQSIERSMIQSFANMAADWITKMAMIAVRWVATQIFMTVVHGNQTAIRTGTHVLGEIAMTAASLAQSLIRRLAAFLEAQPYIFLAAVKAATAVADIPYVGPILAPIAAATTFAALEALAVFKQGGYTGDGSPDQVAGLVHRGEVVIPAERVQQTGVGRLMQFIRSGRFSPSEANLDSAGASGGSGSDGATIQHKTNLSLAMFGGEADAKRWAEGQDGETWFLNQMDRHAYKYQR